MCSRTSNPSLNDCQSYLISLYDKHVYLFACAQHIRRTGWVNRGVKDPEDVAGHMYRMAMMSFLLVPDGGNQLNREK